ncbi:acylamino-acid-releasing enzyme isoform X2 [Daucus carota subsp. sativus]|uniref:acylamino-acid-releasing enzyme isoform X2 n=1 Tax=Daucus carota subsp. sativus TaxID=79200 RepID=UPI0007EF821B|nr:PREDICTED: acylamino-acid-releasing enzyme-like isoform X2 [Daucus carota subsp. sativus]
MRKNMLLSPCCFKNSQKSPTLNKHGPLSLPLYSSVETYITGASQAMFLISQTNLLGNRKRKHILSSNISRESTNTVSFQWATFPIEVTGASVIVPSPSSSKLLVVRNNENQSPTTFEIWNSSHLEKDFSVPQSIHGSVYADGWFEGISWDSSEKFIAYVAEEPAPSKPTFGDMGYTKVGSKDVDSGSWQGQGSWDEDWGETYAGKRQSGLFVIDINSGVIRPVNGIPKSLSVGQVIWAPSSRDSHQNLVFVGWPSSKRKLGIKYCSNRPCFLYAVRSPFHEPEADSTQHMGDANDNSSMIILTDGTTSASRPRFSPDGKLLVFSSAKCSVESGAHNATESLHRIDWPIDGNLCSSMKIIDVVPAVMCAEEGCFPGLYFPSILNKPWLSDGYTMVLSSIWGSTQTILLVNVLSGNVSRISPSNSNFSWDVLALDGDSLISVCSSPIHIPQIKYGLPIGETLSSAPWSWIDVSSSILRCSEKVSSSLSALQFSIMKIPVKDISGDEKLTEGHKRPFEAIFVSSSLEKHDMCDPLIVSLHGGPHDVSLSTFSKSLAFLASVGFSLLIVNYRGSLGFGEEALQSLPGNVGSQDVNDVLNAIDHVTNMGLVDPSKIALLGNSHGGFLATHLIGQAPDKFVAAAVRNPVCNLSLMVGTTDIPDWCYVGAYGSKGKSLFTEAPSAEHLAELYRKSPISHVSKVKAPTLFLLGAMDVRVPIPDGLQYARALKEKGVEVKIIVFPNDVHAINRPQSDFESFLNIGVWFKKYCNQAAGLSQKN